MAVIPFTLRGTTLADKRVGAPLNLEGDLIGKYVARLAAGRAPGRAGAEVTLMALKEHGFA